MLLSLPLVACGVGQPNSEQVETQQRSEITSDIRIACAHGDAAFASMCTVEQAQGSDGLVSTVRHPDGAFRRLLVTQDCRGVIAADGAEVALGGGRYRLPATIKTS
ncbi:hypothetical protein U1708_12970 [Sphingomonas sp. ZB1N12]|uniref:hypothetical protein n=1 Tax=Sphingomonas arabinosi TaxID=3096160 RepID=UPI002FCBFF0E